MIVNPIVNDQKVLRTLGSGLKLKEKQKSNYTLSSRLVITHMKENMTVWGISGSKRPQRLTVLKHLSHNEKIIVR